MILDNIRDGQFIFKNTYSENKKFTIPVDHPNSPDEFFFVHVELTDDKIAQALSTDEEPESDTANTLNTSEDEDLNSIESDQSETSDEEPEKKRSR